MSLLRLPLKDLNRNQKELVTSTPAHKQQISMCPKVHDKENTVTLQGTHKDKINLQHDAERELTCRSPSPIFLEECKKDTDSQENEDECENSCSGDNEEYEKMASQKNCGKTESPEKDFEKSDSVTVECEKRDSLECKPHNLSDSQANSTSVISHTTEEELLGVDSLSLEESLQNKVLVKLSEQQDISFSTRVKSATSSLARCVFPTEKLVKEIEWDQSKETAKMLQDASCSPMPESVLVRKKNIFFSDAACSPKPDTCPPHVTRKLNFLSRDSESQYVEASTNTTLLSTPDSKESVSAAYPLQDPVNITTHTAAEQCDVSVLTEPTKPDTVSVMCSPMPHSTCNISIQNAPAMRSIQCSPLFRVSSEDRSMMADGPEVSDVSVTVQPDVNAASTMTDRPDMVSISTTMTPMKINKKLGKSRLTAEDIRKQHPRAVANQLDTMRIENERKEAVITSLRGDVEKLKTVVKEARTAQHKAERDLNQANEKEEATQNEVQTLNEKCSELQCALEQSQKMLEDERSSLNQTCHELENQCHTLKDSHELELTNLREDYEQNDYRSHYIASQKLVQKLQAELAEYAVLADDLEKSRLVQTELEEAMTVRANKVKVAGDCLLSIHTAIKDQVAELEEKIEIADVQKELTECQAERERLQQEVETLETDLLSMTKELEDTTNRSKLTITNLQSSLEIRERDIDTMENDLFDFRENYINNTEKITNMERKLNTITAELKDENAETSSLKDCLCRLRAQEQALRSDLMCTQEELKETRTYAAQFIHQQACEMEEGVVAVSCLTRDMQAILKTVCNKAGIEPRFNTIETNDESITTSPESEQSVRENEGLTSASTTSTTTSTTQQQPSTIQSSFVSQILMASGTGNSNSSSEIDQQSPNTQLTSNTESESETKHDTAKTSESTVNDVNMSTLSTNENLLPVSDKSAFVPVTSAPSTVAVSSSTTTSQDTGSSQISQATESCIRTLSGDHKLKPPATELTLQNQVSKVENLFQEIMRVAHIIEKTAKSSLMDRKIENEKLKEKVAQTDFEQKHLQGELEYTTEELAESQIVVSDLKSHLETIDTETVRSAELEIQIQKLEYEIRQQHSHKQGQDAEISLLREQQAELLQRLQSTDVSGDMIRKEQENLTLKKEVDKLRHRLYEGQNYAFEISNKAATRIEKLQINWKKAESEIVRFDEMLDIIHRLLMRNLPFVQANKDFKRMLDLIDSREPVPKSEEDTKPLKPIKTS